MNTSFTGKGLPAPLSPTAFRNFGKRIFNGHRSRANLLPGSASYSVKTSVYQKQPKHGERPAPTHSRQVAINGHTLPYKTQAERLAGPPLQATRTTTKSSDSLNTSTRAVLTSISLAKYRPTKPQKHWKTSAKNRYLKPASDTATSSNGKPSKRKALTLKMVKPLERLWQDSLARNDQGENFWHHIGSALAFVAFICLMVWILGETPSVHERMHSEAHDVITFTDKDDRP